MYAVIKTGGKQYRVSPGDLLEVEKVEGNIGDAVSFDKVLMVSDGDNVNLGKPYLKDTTVNGTIANHGKHRKVVVFKYKKRKGYRRKRGHRQHFTLIKIEDIGA
jgi:large subunit ribosomal protein L21